MSLHLRLCLKCVKINGGVSLKQSASETLALKASSGGGFLRGRGDFAIEAPPP